MVPGAATLKPPSFAYHVTYRISTAKQRYPLHLTHSNSSGRPGLIALDSSSKNQPLPVETDQSLTQTCNFAIPRADEVSGDVMSWPGPNLRLMISVAPPTFSPARSYQHSSAPYQGKAHPDDSKDPCPLHQNRGKGKLATQVKLTYRSAGLPRPAKDHLRTLFHNLPLARPVTSSP